MAMNKWTAYFYIIPSRIISFSMASVDLFDWVFHKRTVKLSRFAFFAMVQLFPVPERHAVGKGSPCCHLACEFLYFVVLSINTRVVVCAIG